MSKLTRTPLKRISLVMGVDGKGNPMAWAFTTNEFRRIYLEADRVVVESTKPDSEDKTMTIYPIEKYMAVEYQVQDVGVLLNLKAVDVTSKS